MLKIYITNYNYEEWYWYDINNKLYYNEKNQFISPITYKLFNNDVIDENCKLVFSPIRSDKYIPGIIILNKTYGRDNKNRFLYKCIPNDPKLPIFLIAYNNKNKDFINTKLNKFILFNFSNWNNKHPIGNLLNVLGDVNHLSSYYEYQLYCKNLCISIKEFTEIVNKKMKNIQEKDFINEIISKNNNIEKRDKEFIFTIDPENSNDLDDALSLHENKLSVYIANVPLLIENYEFWKSFSERVSTIYLPDKKRPMLPTFLSENLCSLLENESRFVLSMDIYLNDEFNDIKEIKFKNFLIKINKNYRYNELFYLKDKNYINILNICKELCKKYKYIKEINDSHDLIAYLMIMMNVESAKIMNLYKCGIYRTLRLKENLLNNTSEDPEKKLPSDVLNFIKIWQSSSGIYTNFENRENHDLLSSHIEEYIHITSPIRRLVDLLNMYKLQKILNLFSYGKNSEEFYNNWVNKLEYINTTMRSIRKVQIDCSTLTLFTNKKELLDNIYEGYIFDKIDWGNQFKQYTVYLPEIKIITRINTKLDMENYTKHNFKIYLFEEEVSLKKKIRAELLF